MYNWSTDEDRFKNVRDVVRFLNHQPEVLRVKSFRTSRESRLLKVKFSPDIHPVRKFTIAKTLQDGCNRLAISVIEG